MSVTARDIVIACLFLVLGWVLHMLWEELLDWLHDAFGFAGGMLWNLCALVGILTICLLIGWAVQRHVTGSA